YPTFTGVVLLDNLKIGTMQGPCAAYNCGAPCMTAGNTAATATASAAYLMPNPASNGMVTISDNTASSYNITVTNMLGGVVKTATGTSFEAPSAPGMYFVTYTANANGSVAPKALQLVVK